MQTLKRDFIYTDRQIVHIYSISTFLSHAYNDKNKYNENIQVATGIGQPLSTHTPAKVKRNTAY